MTPLAIEIALHYATRADDYGIAAQNWSAPAVQEVIKNFLGVGLLLNNPRVSENGQPRYIATAGLFFYVATLGQVPLPVQTWKVRV